MSALRLLHRRAAGPAALLMGQQRRAFAAAAAADSSAGWLKRTCLRVCMHVSASLQGVWIGLPPSHPHRIQPPTFNSEYEFILTEKKDKVALITLNRPKASRARAYHA